MSTDLHKEILSLEVEKLHRSKSDRLLIGVCGGIADYFEIDSTMVRVLFVFLAFVGGIGVALYVLLAVLVPSKLEAARIEGKIKGEKIISNPKIKRSILDEKRNTRLVAGGILIMVGFVLLIQQVYGIQWVWNFIWPTVFVVSGLIFIMKSKDII